MKKIFSLFLALTLLAFVVTPALAAKPPKDTCTAIQSGTLEDSAGNTITTGYDQWGYNYQAHMFNGFYGNAGRPAEVATSGDRLMMKWNDAWLSNKSCDGNKLLDRNNGFNSYIGSGAWLTNHASGVYDSTKYFHWNGNVNTNTKSIVVTMDGYPGYKWDYIVNFSLNSNVLTGVLTDNYYPTTGPLNGTIDGNHVVFTFAYPEGSIQGLRTYVGDVDSSGNISGTWTQTGSQGGGGTWSISGFGIMVPEKCSWSDFVKIVAVPETAYPEPSAQSLYGEGMWYELEDGKEIGPRIWGDFAVIQEVWDDPCGEYGDDYNYRSELRKGLGNW